MRESTVLGIIPARGGSKGITHKNIAQLADKPLIYYTIEAARRSRKLTDFIVSTDSEIIASISKELGAKVPFIRPPHLATDEAKSADVAVHAIEEYEKQNKCIVDVVVLLQPTAPLRLSSDIDAAIDLFLEFPQASSLFSCCEAGAAHPLVMYTKQDDSMFPFLGNTQVIRRQEFEPVYIRNGAIYIVTKQFLFQEKKFVADPSLGYIMPRERSINIDEKFDLILADLLLKRWSDYESANP